MPRGDGTGPMGMGPMMGRGAGYCAGYDAPGYAKGTPGAFGGRGRGMGRDFGRGLGWIGLLARHLFAGTPTADEKARLTEQAKAMEGALANIKRRLSELDQEG